MFLSMVDDNASARKSTKDDIKKRYNVAVSRAKDQLWLVHSLDYSTLPQDDLRYGLLEYTLHYKEHLDKALEIKKNADSPFEEEVARYLQKNGYNIVQQYEVSSYRIDIVVIYRENKVALECDGEQFHSTESQIEHDMERQCILERLGWRFVRIRGGQFYRDKEATMEAVYQELEQLGIQPETIDTPVADQTDELCERVKHRAEELRREWYPNLFDVKEHVGGEDSSDKVPDKKRKSNRIENTKHATATKLEQIKENVESKSKEKTELDKPKKVLFNPTLMYQLINLGAITIQRGANKFADWAANMVVVMPQSKPFLKAIWHSLQNLPKGATLDEKELTAYMQYVGALYDHGMTDKTDLRKQFIKTLGPAQAKYFESVYAAVIQYPSTEEIDTIIRENNNAQGNSV